jgi:predicted nucleic acid-binding protein
LEWLDLPRGTLVAFDTAPLIYLIEENPIWLPVVQPFFEAIHQGDLEGITSTVTLTEVLVHPLRRKDDSLAQHYRRVLLNARNVSVLPVSIAIAEQAAFLRAQYGLRTPDAIQLATAKEAGASYFVTNDDQLSLPGPLRIINLKQLQSASSQ